MKTNKRPMVKETEYLSLNDGWRTKEWLIEVFGYNWEDYIDTGYASKCKKREVERPMNNTEYIEYLEKENQELEQANNLLVEDYNKLKALTDKVDLENHSLLNECKQLYKENQEQKQVYEARISEYIKKADKHYLENQELNDLLASAYNKIDFELKDQFLKVVESVLGIHIHMNYKCSCGWESETDTFGDHLLQEIKSAMEKGNNE